MVTEIIGIHGLANKPPKDMLTDWWNSSIREGLAKNETNNDPSYNFHMVYWADRLYAQPVHHEAAYDFDPLYNAEPYFEAAEGSLKARKDIWIDGIRKIGEDVGGSLIDVSHKYFGTDGLSKFVMDKVLRDLAFYYDEDRKIQDSNGNMGVARRVLMDELKMKLIEVRESSGDEIIVIAHSMGSIIAYDVLREIGLDEPNVQIEHFVTIGSPLGLPTVKANIYGANKDRAKVDRVRTPTAVTKSWTNFSDWRDPVCLANHLQGGYGANNHPVEVRDGIVLNDYRGERDGKGHPVDPPGTGKANPHKSFGYLRTPELSKHISALL